MGFRFLHRRVKLDQRVGRHCRVVGVSTTFIGFHDVEPLFQITRETAACGGVDSGARTCIHHHQGGARRRAPAFLRRTD